MILYLNINFPTFYINSSLELVMKSPTIIAEFRLTKNYFEVIVNLHDCNFQYL